MGDDKNRLKALERQVRRMRVAVVGMMVGIVAVVAMGAATITDTLRANKIVFTDALTFETADGRKVAELRDGTGLYLYGNAGNRKVIRLCVGADDRGGVIYVEGKLEEKAQVQVSGRGINIMGRPVRGMIGPWASLYHHKDVFSGLEIRGEGDEMIKLDHRAGVACVEIIDAEGKVTSLMP